MKQLLLLLALSLPAFSEGLLSHQPGTSIAPNRWVSLTTSGYPNVQIVGFSRLACPEALKTCLVMENAPASNSEYQHAILSFSYATGQWLQMEQTPDFHTAYTSPAQHPVGYWTWDSNSSRINYWGAGNGSQGTEFIPWTFWVWDGFGRVGHPIYSQKVNSSTDPTTNQNTGFDYDAAHQVTILYDGMSSAGSVYEFEDAVQQWKHYAPGFAAPYTATCYDLGNPTPNVSYCPPSSYMGSTAFNPADGYFYVFGGTVGTGPTAIPQNGLYRYWQPTHTWTRMTAQGAAGSPAGRSHAGMAWNHRRNLLMVAGGCTGSSCGGNILGDTWLYDPATNTWTQQTPSAGYDLSTAIDWYLAYDETNDVFVVTKGKSNSSGQFIPDIYAYRIDPGSNYAYKSYDPAAYPPRSTAYSLNSTAASGTPGSRFTTDSWARNPSLSVSGSTLLECHPEYGPVNATGQAKYTWPWCQSYSGSLPTTTVPTSATNTSITGSFTGQYQSVSSVLGRSIPSGTYAGTWVAYDGVAPNTACFSGEAVATAASGSTTLTITSPVGTIAAEYPIIGPGIADNTTIISYTVATSTIVISQPTTAALSSAPVRVSLKAGASCTLTSAGQCTGGSCSTSLIPYDGAALEIRPVSLISCGGIPTLAQIAVQRMAPASAWLYVKQWNGSAWVNLGTTALNRVLAPTTNQSYAFDASLSCDASNHPVVAWSEASRDGTDPSGYWYSWYKTPQIYVSSWSGSAWVSLGGSLNVSATNWATDPSITILGGVPYVAFGERTQIGPNLLYLRSWNGSTWSAPGAAFNRNTNAYNNGIWGNPAYKFGWANHVRLDNDGTSVWATWTEQLGPSEYARVYSSKYTSGAGWQAIPGSPMSHQAGSGANPTIAMLSGVPVIAWDESTPGTLRQVYMAKYDSTLGAFTPLSLTAGCVISPAAAGPFTRGQSVSVQFYATGTSCSGGWSASGLAGSGLSLDGTGLLLGTAGGAGSYSATINYGSTAQAMTITINAPACTITTSSLAVATVGVAGYAQTLTQTGCLSGMPWGGFTATDACSGLSLNSTTGAITGAPAPTTAGTCSFTATYDTAAPKPLTITVLPAAPTSTGSMVTGAHTGKRGN